MAFADRVRCWQQLALGSLLWLGANAPAIAQTEPPPQKPADPSATHSTKPTAKPKHSASTQATDGHSSTHTSTQTSTRTSMRTSAQKNKTSHGKKSSKQVARKRGQQAIDSDRAREIQTALIREHYMEGEPSGSWDSATQEAMQRYQADQGWQSKTTPDARALIKLGLGPSHDHLLNPESAMTLTPAKTGTITAPAAPAADPKTMAKPAPAQNDLPHQ